MRIFSRLRCRKNRRFRKCCRRQCQKFNSVEEFVDFHCTDDTKKKYIKKILVVTNGLAAIKFLRDMHYFCCEQFNNDRTGQKKIIIICMTTQQEIDSKPKYLEYADGKAIVPSGANVNNFANVDEIVNQAIIHEVDAVWAGWGHASENPELPRELEAHGIAFIGPPARAMFALGDKIASTIIAQTLGVPTIEWSGSGVTFSYLLSDEKEMDIPDEIYQAACVRTPEEGLKAVTEKEISYPVMIKASQGGGGRGIRKCNNEGEFQINFRRVQEEVPGSDIFVMRCVDNARHIEVQLMGDRYGDVIPFFTRDCTIQRRHQKVIEEAPALIVPEHIRRRMQEDAVKLAKKVGYVNAGTVEYLYTPDDQRYFFLELNPRLQVEHPCTEMLADIGIPAMQLQVAMGIPLHRIADVRSFLGMDPNGTNALPADQIRLKSNCHVIAIRITSEDPAEGFRPASGRMDRLSFLCYPNVCVYFSVSPSGLVHEHSDSQIGHMFVRGENRDKAISKLLCALEHLKVRATFPTTVPYLQGLLNDFEYRNNLFHTGWLDDRIANNVETIPELPPHAKVAIGATMIGHARITGSFAKFQSLMERGQILSTKKLSETLDLEVINKNVKYLVLVNRYSPTNYFVKLNNSVTHTTICDVGNGSLAVTYQNQSYCCHLEEESGRYKVSIGETLIVLDKETNPSELRSPVAGRFVQFLRESGENVKVGDDYAEIESMKAVITLAVEKAGGRLIQIVKPGQILQRGAMIARLDRQDEVVAFRPTNFTGDFDEWCDATKQESMNTTSQEVARSKQTSDKFDCFRLSNRFENVYNSCLYILAGYLKPEPYIEKQIKSIVNELFTVLNDPGLPFSLFRVKFNVVSRRFHPNTREKIRELLKNTTRTFPAEALEEQIKIHLFTADPSDFGLNELLDICENFNVGNGSFQQKIVKDILEEYLATENHFENVSYNKGVSAITKEVPEIRECLRMVYSHKHISEKNVFLRELITLLDPLIVEQLRSELKRIANMFNPDAEPLALFVRQVLNKSHHRNYGQMRKILNGSSVSLSNLLATKANNDAGIELLQKELHQISRGISTVNGYDVLLLLLHEFFFTEQHKLNRRAIYLFIQKMFHVPQTDIVQLQISNIPGVLVFRFEVLPGNPLYTIKREKSAVKTEHPKNGHSRRVVYFLSVLSELDFLRNQNLLKVLKEAANASDDNNFLFIAYPHGQNGFSQVISMPENELRVLGKKFVGEIGQTLKASGVLGVQLVNLMFSRPTHQPIYVTQFDFAEEENLELFRLSLDSENMTVTDSKVRIFRTNNSGVQRLFVRHLIRGVASALQDDRLKQNARLKKKEITTIDLFRELVIDKLDDICGEIRVCTAANKSNKTTSIYDYHHVFLAIDYEEGICTKDWSKATESALLHCKEFLVKYRVTEVEIGYQRLKEVKEGEHEERVSADGQSQLELIRVLYTNEFGAIPEVCSYRLVDGQLAPLDVGQKQARRKGESAFAPHSPIQHVQMQKKRHQASLNRTTYVYDFPAMFTKAVHDQWVEYQRTDPKSYACVFNSLPEWKRDALTHAKIEKFACAYEIVIRDENDPHLEIIRDEKELKDRAATCANDRGMVAWELKVWTPDAPNDRRVVVIANDITFKAGSFSMREHRLYHQATEYSLRHQLAWIFISANSGARIGMAEKVKQRLRLVWNDNQRPEDGVSGISMDCSSDSDLLLAQVNASKMPNGSYLLNAVIGEENDIGVENLVGSGLIAGKTSQAYQQVPTYSLANNSVGIGAYDGRLSHRVCQVEGSHMLLTGKDMLNTLMNDEVYISNDQLGGTQIMHQNGVSHAVASNNFDGVKTIMKWISYLPSPPSTEKGVVRQMCMLKDDGARPVETLPSKSPYDPRDILDPLDGSGGGLFDKGTFAEIMDGWAAAKVVVAGRARLRGMPVGVLAIETRPMAFQIPADPTNEKSHTQTVTNPGQVWTPASAYKTAEAIGDFNREGLPLVFIANIRGFSGGQKDMYEMVLKFGASIVDALRTYTQPVVIYIPPYGELRGGAWAVLDTNINPTCIRMLADPQSRGGILEAPGVVEMKFRERDIHHLLSKSDPRLRTLELQLEKCAKEGRCAPEELQNEIKTRHEQMIPICKAAAVQFADMHDTTARMMAKGAIHDEILWRNSRNYIFDLLKVEQAKHQMARRYLEWVNQRINHSITITIEELRIAYDWVQQIVEQYGVETRCELAQTERPSRYARFRYNADPLIEFANGPDFARELENARKTMLHASLESSSSEIQNDVILGYLQALSLEDREMLLKSLNH